jgi:CBS-domain-containing membrane protein
MTCNCITMPPPATLAKGDSIAEAIVKLQQYALPALPVVDAKGHFLGIFGHREVIGLVLPRAARAGDALQDLSFVGDTVDELRKRLGSVLTEQVGRYMAPHRTVRPETSLVEALLLLYRGDAVLAVCDPAGILVGFATAADAANCLKGDA